ncbi:MAG: alkaline phosphatase family protein [Oscillospiraceae bacterium]|nr:alkaline phosphatase family protein [Oscillospiraceae bacterium]
MKYILIIGDGMADNPVSALGGKTPLEAARKPHIDALARKAALGHVLTVPKNQVPGSDTAILSIFGCDPNRYYTGRSPLEAAGSGVSLQPGDVSYRCNMICLEDADVPFAQKKILSHSAGSIDGETSIALVSWLFAEPEFKAAAEKIGMRVEPSPSFRHIAVQKNGDTRGLVAAPPHDHLGEVIGTIRLHGNQNAEDLWALMELANGKLQHHPLNEARRAAGKLPANGIWFWAEGTAVQLPNFVDTYHENGSVISAVPLVHGIGALTGLKMVFVEGATGENDTNCEGKVAAAYQALTGGDDFVCVHVEAPDEATHNGNLAHKIDAIEMLDSRIVAPLTEKLDAAGIDYRILMLSDHKTLMATRGHDGDPVPYMIYDSTKNMGTGKPYTEQYGEEGPYVDAGVKLMGLLFGEGAE